MILVTIDLFISCLNISCKNETETIQDVDPVKIQVHSDWFNEFGKISHHKELFELIQKDSSLTGIIAKTILNQSSKDSIISTLFDFLNDSNRVQLRDSVSERFGTYDWQNNLGEAFARYHASFPDRDIPEVYTLITDFSFGIFNFRNDAGKDALGIGLEMFCGNTELFDQLSIQNPNFSSYANRTFNSRHLAEKIMTSLARDALTGPATNKVLDNLLYQGKILYLVKKWLPRTEDTILFEYTAPQMAWVKSNELDMWRYLLSEKLLYKVSGKSVADLCEPAPHTQGMPPEAPGRAANYIGYKIISQYMKKMGVSDQALSLNTNYDRLLKESNYKPR